jgi:hypothetical protein
MKFPTITICGSMRYFNRMLIAANDLTEQGWIVHMPLVAHIPPEEQDNNSTKQMLDEMHFAKIDLSSAIYVVGEYRGHSTTREILHARETGKRVIYAERELTPNTPMRICNCGALDHGWTNHRSWCTTHPVNAPPYPGSLNRIGTVGAE